MEQAPKSWLAETAKTRKEVRRPTQPTHPWPLWRTDIRTRIACVVVLSSFRPSAAQLKMNGKKLLNHLQAAQAAVEKSKIKYETSRKKQDSLQSEANADPNPKARIFRLCSRSHNRTRIRLTIGENATNASTQPTEPKEAAGRGEVGGEG